MTGPGHLLLEAVEEIGIDDFCHFYFINGLLLSLILGHATMLLSVISIPSTFDLPMLSEDKTYFPSFKIPNFNMNLSETKTNANQIN